MENPLSKLALDYWYQVLMVVCVAVFLLVGTGVLSAFPIAPTAIVSAGGFFMGLGEWVNHPLRTAIMPRSATYGAGVITGHPRSNSVIGVCFDVIGAALICFGLYRFAV